MLTLAKKLQIKALKSGFHAFFGDAGSFGMLLFCIRVQHLRKFLRIAASSSPSLITVWQASRQLTLANTQVLMIGSKPERDYTR